MYVGHKLKAEKVNKTTTKMSPHLNTGEVVVAVAACNNLRPMVDRLVITTERLLACHANDGVVKYAAAHSAVLDVVSTPGKQTLAIFTTDGREQVFKMVKAEDHRPLVDELNKHRQRPLSGTGVADELKRDLVEAKASAQAEAEAPTAAQRAAIEQGFPEKHRALVEPLLGHLDAAVAAAERHDILGEERAIAESRALAKKAGLIAFNGPKWLEARILELTQQGHLRRDVDLIGVVGNDLTIMSDRILHKGKAYLLDADVRASVELNGQVLQSSRPTMTRMAIGSVLPGSALLVGLAAPKTSTNDMRKAQFVMVHPKWRIVESLNPDSAHKLTGLAAQVTAIAEGLQRKESLGTLSPSPAAVADQRPVTDPLDQLKKLGELRDAGILTDEEFAAKKEDILSRM